jgi:ribosomal protein S18 acetylase RimI-like enzyme
MSKILIRKANSDDMEAIWQIFEKIVQTADTYSFYPDTGRQYAIKYWMKEGATPFVAEIDGKIAGTFTIRDNKAGLGSHIANASYMVHPDFQGMGVGKYMASESLEIAKEMGYRAMQFNYVISTNERAVKLWKSVGFEIVGTVPEAFYHKDLGYVPVYIMWRKL